MRMKTRTSKVVRNNFSSCRLQLLLSILNVRNASCLMGIKSRVFLKINDL